MRKLLLWIFLSSLALSAQRLPRTAIPEHYALYLNPDLKSGALSGRAEIKPSEIMPQAYESWCRALGVDPESMRAG